MINYMVGRYRVFFTNHALDRWWERAQCDGPIGRTEARRALDRAMVGVTKIDKRAPPWAPTNRWDQARTEGYLYVTDDIAFPVVRDADGSRVAVTCVHKRGYWSRAPKLAIDFRPPDNDKARAS